MPVRVKKLDGKYQVSHSGKVSAKSTSKKKAEKQANLLRAVSHGWKPTGNEDAHHQASLGDWWNKRSSL